MSLTQKYDEWSKGIFEQKNQENLTKAGTLYQQALVDVLSVAGDPDHPSRPGQAPHEVSGKLRASIEQQINLTTNTATTKATATYARFLVGKRPFFRLAYERVKAQIEQILLRK